MLLASLPANAEAIAIGSPMLYMVFFTIVAALLLVDFFTFKTPPPGKSVSMKH